MVLDSFKHVGFLWNLELKVIVIKWTHQKWPRTSAPVWNLRNLLTPAECHQSSGGFFMASNMTNFYETWNLSLLSSKEPSKIVIMDPSPSQEPPNPPKLQQSVIIIQECSWQLQTWRIFFQTWNLSLLSPNEQIKNVIMDPSPSQESPSFTTKIKI